MSNTNTVVSLAIATLNEAAQKRAQSQAASLIQSIRGLQCCAASKDASIAALQTELKAVEADEFNFESIVGQTPGSTANTETIVNTIGQMNKNRQSEISGKAARLGQAVLALQNDKAVLTKEIDKLRAELGKITVETVNETAILG